MYFFSFITRRVDLLGERTEHIRFNRSVAQIGYPLPSAVDRLRKFSLHFTNASFIVVSFFFVAGSRGVPDMTVISDIDEDGINKNLQARYSNDLIYVSF